MQLEACVCRFSASKSVAGFAPWLQLLQLPWFKNISFATWSLGTSAESFVAQIPAENHSFMGFVLQLVQKARLETITESVCFGWIIKSKLWHCVPWYWYCLLPWQLPNVVQRRWKSDNPSWGRWRCSVLLCCGTMAVNMDKELQYSRYRYR